MNRKVLGSIIEVEEAAASCCFVLVGPLAEKFGAGHARSIILFGRVLGNGEERGGRSRWYRQVGLRMLTRGLNSILNQHEMGHIIANPVVPGLVDMQL